MLSIKHSHNPPYLLSSLPSELSLGSDDTEEFFDAEEFGDPEGDDVEFDATYIDASDKKVEAPTACRPDEVAHLTTSTSPLPTDPSSSDPSSSNPSLSTTTESTASSSSLPVHTSTHSPANKATTTDPTSANPRTNSPTAADPSSSTSFSSTMSAPPAIPPRRKQGEDGSTTASTLDSVEPPSIHPQNGLMVPPRPPQRPTQSPSLPSTGPSNGPAAGSGSGSNVNGVSGQGQGQKQGQGQGQGDDSHLWVTNLETGERWPIGDEGKKPSWSGSEMTVNSLESKNSAGKGGNGSSEGGNTKPEKNGKEDEGGEKPNKEEEKEKSGSLGFFSLFRRSAGASKPSGPGNSVKVKVKKQNRQDMTALRMIQSLKPHSGPVWTVAFSQCGSFVATGGQDSTVIVWAVKKSAADAEIIARTAAVNGGAVRDSAPAAAAAGSSGSSTNGGNQTTSSGANDSSGSSSSSSDTNTNGSTTVGDLMVNATPYVVLSGHKADVVDLAWSKANFILSASLDKTVRLWHVSRQKCLRVFQHTDFVTTVSFHPIEDRYFLSGSFDKKLRVWNIPSHKVVEWVQTASVITAAAFSPDGEYTTAGLYNGQVVIYHTDQLKYRTLIDCRNRSGRNSAGKKVTGLNFSPDGLYLLVTTNDSRLRLYDMDDFTMISKYKGLKNEELQIKAHLSQCGRKIICASEDESVYVWDAITDHRKDNHSESYETFKAHTGVVTCADFVPVQTVMTAAGSIAEGNKVKQCIVTAGYNGEIRFFENRGNPAPT